MKWFRRRRNPELPALVDPPKAGEEIVLDDEELEALEAASRSGLASVLASIEAKGLLFPEPVANELEDYVMVEGFMKLLALARRRMDAGDFAGAARTCVKVIGLGGTLHNPKIFAAQEAWLLMAEVHARYGDVARAAAILHQADRLAREEMDRLAAQGPQSEAILEAFRSDWQSRYRKVKALL